MHLGFLLESFMYQSILSLFSGLPKLLIIQDIWRILSSDQGDKSHGWQSCISFDDNFASAETGDVSDIFSYLSPRETQLCKCSTDCLENVHKEKVWHLSHESSQNFALAAKQRISLVSHFIVVFYFPSRSEEDLSIFMNSCFPSH